MSKRTDAQILRINSSEQLHFILGCRICDSAETEWINFSLIKVFSCESNWQPLSFDSVIDSKIAIKRSMENVKGPTICCLISDPRATLLRFRIFPAFFKKNRLSVLG